MRLQTLLHGALPNSFNPLTGAGQELLLEYAACRAPAKMMMTHLARLAEEQPAICCHEAALMHSRLTPAIF